MTQRLISPVYGFGGSDRHTRREGGTMRNVPVPLDTFEALLPSARERGISVQELVQRLLATIGSEKMATAVLDDEAEIAARKGGR
ncbi:MAG: hypothetical protein AB1647_13360 [Pseudomonadota bacterium]